MANQLVPGLPAQVLSLVQEGAIERSFHDGLVPQLGFRAEALQEEWPANSGTEIFMTRPGLLAPVVRPITPGTDPTPSAIAFEQWTAVLAQYCDTMDTSMPASVVAAANILMRNIHQQGIQAGMSINRVARNKLFQTYLSGQSVGTAAIAAIDTTIHVAALNGFTDVLAASGAKPVAVSPSAPLSVRIGTGAGSVLRNVIGFVPDDVNNIIGPGTLTLSAAVGSAFPIRTSVVSAFAPRVVRAAAGASVDAIGAGDTFTLQAVINAVSHLRMASVQPHEDGFFHAHISPLANAQLFADPVFQRLNQSLPEGVTYREGFLGTISGVMFYMNNESPSMNNSGLLIGTGLLAQHATDIGAEVVNGAGVQIGRVLLTGKGALYEKYLDESGYVSEAGVMGKIAEFSVVNNGVSIATDKIRLILQAPLDRLQQKVATTWSITTSFSCPSDALAASGPERFKRAIVIEHAL